MTVEELKSYILNRKYHCHYCVSLQQKISKEGLKAIKSWDGMVCNSIIDMQIRLDEVETGRPFVASKFDLEDDIW